MTTNEELSLKIIDAVMNKIEDQRSISLQDLAVVIEKELAVARPVKADLFNDPDKVARALSESSNLLIALSRMPASTFNTQVHDGYHATKQALRELGLV
mgnify:CR=1 FL=1